MKIKRNKQKLSQSSIALLVIVIILLATAGFFATYAYINKSSIFGWSPFGTKVIETKFNTEKPTDEQKMGGDQIKQDSIEKEATQDDNTNTPSSPIKVTITANTVNGPTYQVRARIDDILSEGACKITLSQNDKVLTKEASVQPTANFSTCAGFDIPVSELGNGSWNVKIIVTSTERTGDATTVINI